MRVLVCSLLTLSCFGASSSVTSRPRVLAFEARNAEYVSHGAGYQLSVSSGGAVLSLSGHAVRMSVAGASPKSSLQALDRMPGKANYLLGSHGRVSYDLYGCVRWRGLTPGYYHLPPAGLQFGFASIREIRVNSSVPLQFLLAAIGGSPGVSPHRICVDPRSSAGHKPVVNTTRKRALPLIMRS